MRQLFILHLQSRSKEQTRSGAALRNLKAYPHSTHLLKLGLHPAGNQMFKHMSLFSTFHIETITLRKHYFLLMFNFYFL